MGVYNKSLQLYTPAEILNLRPLNVFDIVSMPTSASLLPSPAKAKIQSSNTSAYLKGASDTQDNDKDATLHADIRCVSPGGHQSLMCCAEPT